MSSRLDPFFAEVFERLNQQGLSYRSVCGYLSSVGVKVSPQALRSWHIRRSQKLVARSVSMPSGHVFGSVTALKDSGFTANGLLQANRATIHAVEVKVEPGSQTASSPGRLQVQIEQEERKLALHTQNLGVNFLVPRKSGTSRDKSCIQLTDIGPHEGDGS